MKGGSEDDRSNDIKLGQQTKKQLGKKKKHVSANGHFSALTTLSRLSAK
jgi:hypothetical protein